MLAKADNDSALNYVVLVVVAITKRGLLVVCFYSQCGDASDMKTLRNAVVDSEFGITSRIRHLSETMR